MSLIDDIKADREAGTPGPWRNEVVLGWGDAPCILAGEPKPFVNFVRPASYYTDFVKKQNDDGSTSTILSTETARKAGNYIATKEHQAEVRKRQDRDARRIARVPDLEQAYLDLREKADALADAAGVTFSEYPDARLSIALAAYREATQ